MLPSSSGSYLAARDANKVTGRRGISRTGYDKKKITLAGPKVVGSRTYVDRRAQGVASLSLLAGYRHHDLSHRRHVVSLPTPGPPLLLPPPAARGGPPDRPSARLILGKRRPQSIKAVVRGNPFHGNFIHGSQLREKNFTSWHT
mmetsp:Transcript_48740/g.162642  ORF Transcript_48740/g.162642 Transcript_48740/m.162642 type:complete len:144 (+) Transcript_48740:289-720(+)